MTQEKREEMGKRLVESLCEIQEGDGGAAQFPCPRCGRIHCMDPVAAHNALSRRAKVYICADCGMSEAIMDMAGEPPLPFSEWGMVKGFAGGS